MPANTPFMRSVVCLPISASSVKYFHSVAGTRISALGYASLLSGVSRPLMWSPWKCEMITVSTWLRSMPDAFKLFVELAGRTLAALEIGLARASVDHHELAAGVDDDGRVGDGDHVGTGRQVGGRQTLVHLLAALARHEAIRKLGAGDAVGDHRHLVRADLVAVPAGVLRAGRRRSSLRGTTSAEGGRRRRSRQCRPIRCGGRFQSCVSP